MPRMLADGKDKLLWVPDGGIVDIENPKVSELTAPSVIDLSQLVSKNNFNLGPSGDNEISDAALGSEVAGTAPGLTTFDASMEFYRFTTTLEDIPWTTFTGKGLEGNLVHRHTSKDSGVAVVATDEVDIYAVITGTPRSLAPTGDGGYRKFAQGFYVQDAALRVLVAAGS